MIAPITESELARFQDFVTERLGLQIPDSQKDALADLLRSRLRGGRSKSPDAYLATLVAGIGVGRELLAIAEALTVGETYFYRTPDHWRALGETVLPTLWKAASPNRSLRLLSAGCASGEEPYTMAMTVRECLPADAQSQVSIRGIDVNPISLEEARRATYSKWALRGVDETVRQRYFSKDARGFHLAAGVRERVTFELRNLIEEDAEFWRPGAFDVIFCRNVSIYFSPEATRRLIARIAGALVPGGYLFLGPAESLRGISRDFDLQHTHETFYYRHRGAVDRSRPSAVGGFAAAAQPAQTAEALTPALDDSWVETILHASERISRLAVGLEVQPSKPTPGPSAPALAEATTLFREERFTEALEVLKQLSAQDATDPDALLLLASTLVSAGKLADAEVACQQALAIDGLSAGAHYLLALCREHDNDLEAAMRHDETAIHLDPAFAMPHLHLGRLATRAGKPASARTAFERALVLLAREDVARILLFGGGFSRDVLQSLCQAELQRIAGTP